MAVTEPANEQEEGKRLRRRQNEILTWERDLAQWTGHEREEPKSLSERSQPRKNYEQKHKIFQN
jgi:hypothetical protein